MQNRLQYEDSPYLQQHKNNPVDWYPWCEEAFNKAREENKAIFISIGYSSCHWCHVMEEKVFENKECADILNDKFICIKVDREERPDIDKHYQEVYQLLNKRAGGWPTSIFCTSENKPFFAGTYIPPESDAGSIEGMGFIELAKLIGSKVALKDKDVLKNADEIDEFIKNRQHPTQATKLTEDIVKNFMLQAKNNYQPRYGGFSVAPKFPQANTLLTLLNIDKLYDDKSARAMVKDTLDSMKKGGMYDLVDGGFCRYSVDEKYLVPHFEKMLYDNALLCELYTKSYLAYNDEEYLFIAKEIADFWYNFMSEDELFYSASDADSNSKEGTYFIYGYDEVKNILENANYQNIEAMLDEMNVTKDGNFKGKNIIRFEDGIPEYFQDVKKQLQCIREKRKYPFCDKKVQTSWSSMMIKSLFILGSIDTKYKQKAINFLEKLIKTMHIHNNLYHTTLIHKEPKIKAFLEDYAFLSSALLEGYKHTQNEIYLINAQKYANKALEDFYNHGQWLFSNDEFQTVAEVTDNTYTSSVSVMVEVLLTLGSLLNDEKYKHFAYKTLEYNSYELARKPIYYPYLFQQMLRDIKGDKIIKSTLHNLEVNSLKLASIKYPFIQLRIDDEDTFTICSNECCFANTKDVNELDSLI